MAAKQEQQIAELYEGEGKMDDALQHYTTASDYFEGEGQSSAASKLKLKIAATQKDQMALGEKYSAAIENYEATATSYLQSNLLKWSAKELFLKAGICHLCMDDLVSAKRAAERYQDLDVTFATQRECKLLNKITECVESMDAEALTNAIREYNHITPLDEWKTTLLLRVKNAIIAAGGGGGGGDGVEDMT